MIFYMHVVFGTLKYVRVVEVVSGQLRSNSLFESYYLSTLAI